ncbi:DUF4304 domain-containing protein [Sphingobacterium siyangense]|uniref:DUF4304 domain-containing protein n=1 Tax=Sphingobacterium siyangense TaxID=459529 RepID=UPI001965FFAD|nr:DUF4304 domain-containing protein [Sphingobacterium siyangense]QRY55548.1 DUF4304 domain-containing protein [Sphingobacterium siyangense]
MMHSKEFKTVFDEVAKINNFSKAFGGWYKESPECIAILELQKSNFGDYYKLNIKIFIQGLFDQNYSIDKDLIKYPLGHANSNETLKYKEVFDFDKSMDDKIRKEKLEELFINHIVPFTGKALSKAGIMKMHVEENLFLMENVKDQLF